MQVPLTVEVDIRQKATHMASPKHEHLWGKTLPKPLLKHDTELLHHNSPSLLPTESLQPHS